MKTRLLLWFLFSASVLAQPPGVFTSTGSLSTPRFSQTATLLPNGKVLVAGGITLCFYAAQPCPESNTAELYDPATGLFSVTGDLSPRAHHTGGILLSDGRVLFAANDFDATLADVELYDPMTGTFSVAGNSATLCYVESATLLNDGTVLLRGLIVASKSITYGAEIYDPIAATFSPVPGWPSEDPWPVAVLADGRVFLVYYEAYAGLYDPATSTFTRTNGILGFYGPPAASLLLSGDLLFTGGNDIGGSETSAELYDPSTDTYTHATMHVARDGHTSTLLPDGTVLLTGGKPIADEKYPSTSTATIYDPAAANFIATANMSTGRAEHTATLLKNGQVLITGGTGFGSSNSISGISSAELYTPALLVPAPVLFSISGDGQGQGAIWHATTGQLASVDNPAVAGEILSMYTTSLADGGVIPPQVAVGGRLAQIQFFGDAPGYPGYYQVNFQVPAGVAAGSAAPVRLTYLGCPSNEVTIAVQ